MLGCRFVSQHSLDIKLFDTYRLVFANKCSRELLQIILTLVGNLGVYLCQSPALLFVVL